MKHFQLRNKENMFRYGLQIHWILNYSSDNNELSLLSHKRIYTKMINTNFYMIKLLNL